MMGLDTIIRLNAKQGRKAKARKSKPWFPASQTEADCPEKLQKIPNIGGYRPKGYTLDHTLFVDKSGFGAENEPALTLRAFKARVSDAFWKGDRFGYAIIEEGQFQVVVGVFVETGKAVPGKAGDK